jgi:HEAT repeat protein
LVRGHVAWALGQIGSTLAVAALQRRLQLETDPAVRAEIDAAIDHLGADTGVLKRE